MKCPFCRDDNDRVTNTRSSDEGFVVRRRRLCLSCHKRFTTYERIEVTNVRVVKRDGTRVPFDRNKLREGLERACWKRPVSEAQISAVIAELETIIENDGETEVDTNYIGEKIMALLKNLDDVAYVRFASVYRRFKSVQDFADELKPMLDSREETHPE
ncbi:MAG: transcriptional regulator NrdR [Planctomycetia bacterium]|nr:transcriptional regulator NrdR [Planctomycetia bacterium]